MIAPFAVAALFGAGLWLVATGLPWMQRRPDLATQLRRLSAQGRMELEAAQRNQGPAVFASAILERVLRPIIECVELPTVLDLLAMAASAGLSPEQALADVSRQIRGALGDGLRVVAREASLGTATHPEGLRALAAQEGVPEIVSMADAWQSALEQGLPLGQVMLTLADTVRERKRATLIAEGEKSSIRMLFPVVLFIFPVFLVVLLYPAGVQLLGLSE